MTPNTTITIQEELSQQVTSSRWQHYQTSTGYIQWSFRPHSKYNYVIIKLTMAQIWSGNTLVFPVTKGVYFLSIFLGNTGAGRIAGQRVAVALPRREGVKEFIVYKPHSFLMRGQLKNARPLTPKGPIIQTTSTQSSVKSALEIRILRQMVRPCWDRLVSIT